MEKVRIDKWLWAARFYKTRSLAKSAIENGKVHIDGNKSKASWQLEVGTVLAIRQGFDIKTVENEIWSQQNLFSVDKESKVLGVEGDYKESSDKNVICPLVTSYFEKIDFPEDTQKYLDNLYEQIKPNLQITQIK